MLESFHVRVLHLGHLTGLWQVLEYHLCPQHEQTLTTGGSFQW